MIRYEFHYTQKLNLNTYFMECKLYNNNIFLVVMTLKTKPSNKYFYKVVRYLLERTYKETGKPVKPLRR